jgi:galactose mutarotase-like enzyme
MIINGITPVTPPAAVYGIGFVPACEPELPRIEVPGHLIAPAGGYPRAMLMASGAPSRGSSSGRAGGPGGIAGTPPASGSGGADDSYTITNGVIMIGVKNAGAELTSLRSEKTGLEYLWQGDPKFWGKHAPVLFPIVGRLKDDTYTYQGRTYHMNQHGLARTMRFELARKKSDAISFRLRYDEETLKQYPFKFQLKIGYALEGDALRVDYEVRNLDDEVMLFSIGAHPGFRCPLLPTEEYEDYSIMWDHDVRLRRYFLEDGLVASHTEPLVLGERELRLTRDMFNRDAIVFKDIGFQRVRLVNRQTGHGVTMSMKGFPYFGIWAKPGANFVCLEPWKGVGDSVHASGRLMDKEGILPLKARDMFRASYSIKPH